MKLDREKQDALKREIGKRAAELVQEGMLVGLGTGSTASCFIGALIKRCKEGLTIKAVSSSVRSLEMAKTGGIPTLSMDEVTHIDLTIDGADEIDPQNRMIKGGGGAHVREKILASTSAEMVVIVDESKLVQELGQFGLPVELIPFGYKATLAKLERAGFWGKMRKKEDGALYVTDNGNYLLDIHSPTRFPKPEIDHDKIINIPGVVDTGFFFNLASRVLVGYADGHVAFREE